jgi:hypothetical protein
LSVRIEPTAEAPLAAIRARNKFGIAMAAMIKMIATTISNSINENPFALWFFSITCFSLADPQTSTIYLKRLALHSAYRARPAPFELICVSAEMSCKSSVTTLRRTNNFPAQLRKSA